MQMHEIRSAGWDARPIVDEQLHICHRSGQSPTGKWRWLGEANKLCLFQTFKVKERVIARKVCVRLRRRRRFCQECMKPHRVHFLERGLPVRPGRSSFH